MAQRRKLPARLAAAVLITWVGSVPAVGSPCAPAPAVEVVVAPGTTYVGATAIATFTVRNPGGQAAEGVRLDPQIPTDLPATVESSNCLLADGGCRLEPDATLAVRIALTPAAAMVATVGARVTTTSPDADLSHASATSQLSVKQPRVEVSPPIGPPGFVTSTHGVDFPPGATITLTWLPGVTAVQAPATVAADGTFDAPMLIVRPDRPGPRLLVAAPATGPAFTQVTAPFLVVSRALQPSRFVNR